jgi:putative flippase GtrA
MENIIQFFFRYEKPLKFLVGGFLANVTNYAFYILMVAIGLYIFVAGVVGYLMGLIISYLVNRFWVFRISSDSQYARSARSQAGLFFILHGFSAIFMGGLITFFKDYLSLSASISWVFAAIPIAFLNYLALNFSIFRAKKLNSEVS